MCQFLHAPSSSCPKPLDLLILFRGRISSGRLHLLEVQVKLQSPSLAADPLACTVTDHSCDSSWQPFFEKQREKRLGERICDIGILTADSRATSTTRRAACEPDGRVIPLGPPTQPFEQLGTYAGTSIVNGEASVFVQD